MGHRARAVVVTGAAGFIGSHVVEALLARGDRVVGIDNFDPYYDVALKARNVECGLRAAGDGGEGPGRYEFIEADICDGAAIGEVFDRVQPDGVIHLAAKAGVRPSIADPAGYARANVLGASIIQEEARRAGCGRLVMASSSSVYGNCRVPPGTPFAETLDVNEPISPYAATKRACELIAHTHWHLTGMPTGCLRFFTVFGPRQRPDLAIGRFLRIISRGETVPMYGDGSTSRDYTFIHDIVAGVLAAYDRIDRHGYRVWNLGGHRPVSLREMIAAAARVVGREPIVEQLPMQPGDVERTYADLSRSEAELGFRPATSLEDGMARQWAWMRSEGLA
jgi:UDP-glucuronate 4-epimerase